MCYCSNLEIKIRITTKRYPVQPKNKSYTNALKSILRQIFYSTDFEYKPL